MKDNFIPSIVNFDTDVITPELRKEMNDKGQQQQKMSSFLLHTFYFQDTNNKMFYYLQINTYKKISIPL